MTAERLREHPVREMPARVDSNLPVSEAMDNNGAKVVVSRYGDTVWDFWPQIHIPNTKTSQKRIDWAARLPNGHSLLNAEHAPLLASAKAFLYSLLADPIEGRKRLKAQTLIRKFKALKTLLRWMVARGYGAFREIDDFDGYVVHAKTQAIGATKAGEPHAPAVGTVRLRLHIVEDLWLQSLKLADGLSCHPWAGEPMTSRVATVRVRHHQATTEALPDAVARDLVQSAIQCLDLSDTLLAARASIAAVREAAHTRGLLRYTTNKQCAAEAQRYGYADQPSLAREAIFLRTACFIVIGFFSGIRNSEILSLEEGCLVQDTDVYGEPMLWLHGTLYKTVDSLKGMAVRWLVPPVVERAVNILERLTGPLRERLSDEKIQLAAQLQRNSLDRLHDLDKLQRRTTLQDHSRRLFLAKSTKTKTIGPLSNRSINQDLKRFVSKFAIRDENGELWNLHTHQFRRTFARFVARHALGDLHYLRHHFKHWSLDMTAYYADAAMDHDLLTDVAHYRDELQQTLFAQWLEADQRLAGGAAARFEVCRQTLCITAKNKAALIHEIADDAYIRGTGHSWCLSTAEHAYGSLCLFEKTLCIDCPNAIIDDRHIGVWREIERQQIEVLACADLGAGGRKRAERFLAGARVVLSRLQPKGQEATQ